MWIERDGGGSCLSAAAALLLAGAFSSVSASADDATSPSPTVRIRGGSAMARAALERAAEGALRRLEDPECQKIFSDFEDDEGRPLQATLDALGETGASYLTGRLWFEEASGVRACQSSGTVAATRVGGSVVFVCARQLQEWIFRDPAFVENILIHEELHALGLGENLPSSFEINGQIARRCGHR
jgi:hypothetical protein